MHVVHHCTCILLYIGVNRVIHVVHTVPYMYMCIFTCVYEYTCTCLYVRPRSHLEQSNHIPLNFNNCHKLFTKHINYSVL